MLIESNIFYLAAPECTQLSFKPRTLVMLPLNFHLATHSDSHTAITAVNSLQSQPSERHKLHMAARPDLLLISYLREPRISAVGTSELDERVAVDDIRRSARACGNIGYSSVGLRLVRVFCIQRRHNWASPSSTFSHSVFLHVATNSMHFYWSDIDRSRRRD